MARMVSDALLVLAVIGWAPYAWILRDGPGPGAVDSVGTVALSRWFGAFCAGPVVIGLAVTSLALRQIARKLRIRECPKR